MPGKSHQMSIVKVNIGTEQSSPPCSETATILNKRVIGGQNYSINTVISAGKMFAIVFTKLINHNNFFSESGNVEYYQFTICAFVTATPKASLFPSPVLEKA
jgi:hypothetical protein